MDIKLAKHTCGKNRAVTTEGTARKKKKDQAIFGKLLTETFINMETKIKLICISKQNSDQSSRKQSGYERIIHMSRK